MKSVMSGRSGWINRGRLAPPLRVLWYQRSCYQQPLLLFGPHSPPVWHTSYHDNHQSHTSSYIIIVSTNWHYGDIVMLDTTAQGEGLNLLLLCFLSLSFSIYLSPFLLLAESQTGNINTRSPTVPHTNGVKWCINFPSPKWAESCLPWRQFGTAIPLSRLEALLMSWEWIKADGFYVPWYLFDVSFNF